MELSSKYFDLEQKFITLQKRTLEGEETLTYPALSKKCLNILRSNSIYTIAELHKRYSISKMELLKFDNFSKKKLVEVEELLRDKGLINL